MLFWSRQTWSSLSEIPELPQVGGAEHIFDIFFQLFNILMFKLRDIKIF